MMEAKERSQSAIVLANNRGGPPYSGQRPLRDLRVDTRRYS